MTPTTGDYQFSLQADDGARLYISNNLVLDAWVSGSSTAVALQTTNLTLTAGTNCPIRVEYFEGSNAASVQLLWKTPTASSFANLSTSSIQRPGTNITGWLGLYYNNTNLTGTPVWTNFDSTLNLNWYAGSPNPAIASTTYSARWTGQLQPQYSEPYTFVVRTDDGTKLWINGNLVVDAWTNKSATDVSAVINLQANVRYDIKLEYFQNTGSAEAHLSWFSPSQAKQIIPSKPTLSDDR